MTIAYFDCFAGASGDMLVGALLDAGADFQALQGELAKLGLDGYSLSVRNVRRQGLSGSKFTVDVASGHQDNAPWIDAAEPHGHEPHHASGHAHPHKHKHKHEHSHEHEHPHKHTDEPCEHAHVHRRLPDIRRLIEQAGLTPRAAQRSLAVFERLAAAEAAVHGIAMEEVHFHEVGAVDSILDIVGACVALELLGIDRVLCSPIPTGSGTIRCHHGQMPVPAPATARLLVGARTFDNGLTGECTTPTAAALLTALTEGYGPLPAMEVTAVGWGAGTRDSEKMPNLLRVFVGRGDPAGQADSVVELSANLDDCTGEILGATIEMLLSAGCLDAWASPTVMKKSRPGWILSALCIPADVPRVEEILFRETPTLGIRRCGAQRTKLAREFKTVETPYGPVRIKLGLRDGAVLTAKPEFSDCQSAAQAHHTSISDVLAAAIDSYRLGRHE